MLILYKGKNPLTVEDGDKIFWPYCKHFEGFDLLVPVKPE